MTPEHERRMGLARIRRKEVRDTREPTACFWHGRSTGCECHILLEAAAREPEAVATTLARIEQLTKPLDVSMSGKSTFTSLAPPTVEKIWNIARAALASQPAAEDVGRLRRAAITIEGVLRGMDWLGTGTSQRLANEEEREAWQAWAILLRVLGDTRDPWDRYMHDENDPGPLARLASTGDE